MPPLWYDERPEPETLHRGRLAVRDVGMSPGGRDRLLFELQARVGPPLPIYAPNAEEALQRMAGSDIELVGKIVDLSAEGFGVELWLGQPPIE